MAEKTKKKTTKRPKPITFDPTGFDFGFNIGRPRRSRKLTKSQRYFSSTRGGSGE